MFKRLLLYRRTNGDGALSSFDSILIIDDAKGLVISARELVQDINSRYCVSTDGTKQKLQFIESKKVPIAGPPTPPFAYLIKMVGPVQ